MNSVHTTHLNDQAAVSENAQRTMTKNNGQEKRKNPADITDSTCPKKHKEMFHVLNKDVNRDQPLISSFFPTRAALDKETSISNQFQIETRNRFSALIDDHCNHLGDLDNVVNLSDKVLTAQEHEILNKGLNFCPTPGDPDMGEIRRDLDRYHRSLCIQCWVNKKPTLPISDQQTGPYNDIRSLKIQSNSTWNPPTGPPNLEYIIASNETGLLTTKPKSSHNRTNITRLDAKCIADLARDTTIVIKKADKGGAVVLQNRQDYVNEGLRQLSNGKFYQKMNSDRTVPHNEMVKKQLFDMTTRGEITKSVRDYLILDTPRNPEFYMLPKIHKSTTPPPGRPIISANSSPTERISAFVDHFLRPIVTKGKSYLKDRSDFLKKLQTIRDINEDSLL